MPATSISIRWNTQSEYWVNFDKLLADSGNTKVPCAFIYKCSNDGSGTARADILIKVQESNGASSVYDQVRSNVYFSSSDNKSSSLLPMPSPLKPGTTYKLIVYALAGAPTGSYPGTWTSGPIYRTFTTAGAISNVAIGSITLSCTNPNTVDETTPFHLTGTVKDSAGASLPNWDVYLAVKKEGTADYIIGTQPSGKTNANGQYFIDTTTGQGNYSIFTFAVGVNSGSKNATPITVNRTILQKKLTVTRPDGTVVQAGNNVVDFGMMLTIKGEGFPPSSTVKLQVNDTWIRDIMVGADSRFTTTYQVDLAKGTSHSINIIQPGVATTALVIWVKEGTTPPPTGASVIPFILIGGLALAAMGGLKARK